MKCTHFLVTVETPQQKDHILSIKTYAFMNLINIKAASKSL